MKLEIRSDFVHIEGYVNAVERDSNIINVPSIGQCVEQIRAGAFGQSLRDSGDVDMLENHDINRKLGSTADGNLRLYEDNIGLRAAADIYDNDVIDKARRGLIKGWSFGFVCKDDKVENRADNVPRRIVNALDLKEVSLIDGNMKPCYTGTLVEVRGQEFVEYRSADDDIEIIDKTVEKPVEETEERSEPDYSYYDAVMQLLELRYNPYHDPSNGRFTSGGGGGGGFLYSPNKKKGEKGMNGDGSAFYVAPDTLDKGEKALADGEYEKWRENIKNNLSPKEQLNYEVIRDQLKHSEYQYTTLEDMKKVAKRINEDYPSYNFGEGSDYGLGGKIAMDEFVGKLYHDYEKETKELRRIVKEYEQSRKTNDDVLKYDGAAVKARADERRRKFYSEFK